MKFIHCADLHLDSKMETNLPPVKARERKKEILNTFEKMVDYANQNQVQAIIIAGDMFDTERITNLTKTRVLNVIRKNKNVDFLYLAGNHDENNFIATIQDLPENLKVFNDCWSSFLYGNVKISGVVLTKDNCASVYELLDLSPENINIVAMHGQIVKSGTKTNEDSILLSKLKNKNIDYLALGHIHSYTSEPLDKRGIFAYSGCLEGRGFDELGEKGFVLLDVDEKSIKSQFISFAKRTLIEVEYDISDADNWFDIENQIIEKVKDIDNKNLLKITLKGKYGLSLEKHISMLEQKLERFYFVKIKDMSVLKVSSVDIENDVSLRGEFIKKVMESNLTEEEKEQTILVGLKALMLEDLQ